MAVLVPALLAIILVAAVAGGMPKALAVIIALAVPVFAVLFRVPRRALVACIVAASLFCGAPVKLGQLDLSDVLLLTAALLLLLQRDSEGEMPPLAPLPRAVLFGLALLVLGGIIGSAFEPPSFSAVFRIVVVAPTKLFFLTPRYGELVRLLYGTVGVVLLIRAARLTSAQTRYAITSFALGATVSALWGVINPTAFANRAVGLTAHPIYLGWISAFSAVIGVGLILERGKWSRAIGVATVLAGVGGIAVSGTRSGVLILLAGLFVLQLGLRSVRRSVTFVLLGLVVVSLLVLGVGGDTPVSTRLAGSQSALQSNVQRNVVRQDSFALVRKHGWTGVGLRYLFPPHNLVLGVLAATGAIGFAGLLVVAGSLVRRLIATPPGDVLSVAVLAAVIGTYACMWFVNVGWDRWFWVPIALVLARPSGPEVADGPSDVATRSPASLAP